LSCLLVGGDSEIAAATLEYMQHYGFRVVATTRRTERLAAGRIFLDLAPPLTEWQPPPGTRTACIFAAVGHLLDCHRDPAGSALINVTRTLELVELLVARGIYVLFLSTNQVFDGSRTQTPASTRLSPVSEYGRQKARTETRLQAMMSAGAPVAILRLAKIVAPGMTLLRQWQQTLAARQPIHPFADMFMAPTPIGVAAAAIAALISNQSQGIWQLSGPQDVSYAEIGSYIGWRLRADSALVQAVSAASIGMPEGSTPDHTTLDSSALRSSFGIASPEPWATIDGVLALPPNTGRGISAPRQRPEPVLKRSWA
jgi:dTDP-4-dehydrorhamnose reductase